MAPRLIEPGASPGQTRQVLIGKDEFLIGRGADCDLRLRAAAVSRHHCLIRVRGPQVTLTDLGSSNGTYLNGQRVRSQATLKDGDELRVGDFRFLLELDDQSGIDWGADSGADSSARTYRLPNLQRARAEEEKERGHPLGEAGGQGDAAGQGPG
jgi:pSer/pThr/pTyr-binding forkhead associated (FHA) protein